MRPPRLAALAVLACVLGAGPRAPAAGEDAVFFHENVMGTSMELRVRADGPAEARAAEGRALAAIDRLGKVFSGYDPGSEFSRWQAAPGGPARVSPELFEVLRACDSWRERSGGAFDPRAEAVSRLWSRCAAEGREPTPAETAGALAMIRPPAWRLDPVAGTAERLPGGPLTLNAIAKGYIVGRACEEALAPGRGVRGLVLNVGGDLRVCGEFARPVGVVNPLDDSESSEPLATVEVKNKAVATSGASQRGFRVGRAWRSHVVDPRTGLPASGVAGATVIADRSDDADALATALHVLTPVEGVRLVESVPGAACLIVGADGRVSRSAGWRAFETERPAPGPLAVADGAGAGGDWGDAFELAVDFEVNRPPNAGGRYRRPYVAVWVEDKDGFPVRTLILWVSQGGSGPFQWMPDLKRWYRSDQARKKVDKTELILTMSRPTRPAGKYSAVWDGKDDHGKPVGAGEYTVQIDAAREHGTYQNLRKTVTVGGRPFSEDLGGGVEIKAASLEYRRKRPSK